MTSLTITGPLLGQGAACAPILRGLPHWFGIEEATRQYIRDINSMPTLLAWTDGRLAGFLTINQHTPFAAEIHVMGILPDLHRQGIGRALVAHTEALLRHKGLEFLQVKTLSPAHPDRHYARTRRFYAAMGFRPLQEFRTLWGKENPCLQMVKRL